MSTKDNKTINTEEKKRFFMKLGVIVLSVLIFSLWIFSLSFSFSSKANNIDESDNSWRQDLQETINTVRSDFGNIKKEPNVEEKAFLDGMLNNIENKEDSDLIYNEIEAPSEPQKFLKELENKLPLGDKVNLDCPAYIDCMPTIGQSKPCVIPPGCESITQIAY